MTEKVIKFLIAAIYAVTVGSHCFFADKALNINLSSKVLFAHFYSFPVLFGTVIAAAAVLLLIAEAVKGKKAYFTKCRFLFPAAMLLISLVFVFCSSDVKKITENDGGRPSIKIVELNAQNRLDREAVSKIFKSFDADIAVLPEFGGYTKGGRPEERLADLLESAGIDAENYNYYVSDQRGESFPPVTVAVKKAFHEYQQADHPDMTRFGTVRLESGDENFADIIGLHTAPPRPGLMASWKRDLDLIAGKIIPQNKDALLLGDFNATSRHAALNLIETHDDALAYLPRFKKGTWGLFLPEAFRTGIDHVYFPKDKYQVNYVDVFRFNGPDHMGLFVELSPIPSD